MSMPFPDSTVGAFYITEKRDSRFARIAGPFATRQEALTQFDAVRVKRLASDPFAWFDEFGTARIQ